VIPVRRMIVGLCAQQGIHCQRCEEVMERLLHAVGEEVDGLESSGQRT